MIYKYHCCFYLIWKRVNISSLEPWSKWRIQRVTLIPWYWKSKCNHPEVVTHSYQLPSIQLLLTMFLHNQLTIIGTGYCKYQHATIFYQNLLEICTLTGTQTTRLWKILSKFARMLNKVLPSGVCHIYSDAWEICHHRVAFHDSPVSC